MLTLPRLTLFFLYDTLRLCLAISSTILLRAPQLPPQSRWRLLAFTRPRAVSSSSRSRAMMLPTRTRTTRTPISRTQRRTRPTKRKRKRTKRRARPRALRLTTLPSARRATRLFSASRSPPKCTTTTSASVPPSSVCAVSSRSTCAATSSNVRLSARVTRSPRSQSATTGGALSFSPCSRACSSAGRCATSSRPTAHTTRTPRASSRCGIPYLWLQLPSARRAPPLRLRASSSTFRSCRPRVAATWRPSLRSSHLLAATTAVTALALAALRRPCCPPRLS